MVHFRKRLNAEILGEINELILQEHQPAENDHHDEDDNNRGTMIADTYRIKGLIQLQEGSFQADCVGAYVNVARFDGGRTDNRLVVLAGEGIALRKSLKEALSWFPLWVKEAPE